MSLKGQQSLNLVNYVHLRNALALGEGMERLAIAEITKEGKHPMHIQVNSSLLSEPAGQAHKYTQCTQAQP